MWTDEPDLACGAQMMQARTRAAALVPAVAGGLLGCWAIVVIHEGLPVEPGEPWVLAWSRLAAEHPARIATALALLIWAVDGGRNPAGTQPGKASSEGLSLPSP